MNTFQMDNMMFKMNVDLFKKEEQLEYIRKSIDAEIATRNHQDMTEKEKGILEGLLIASKIVNKGGI